MRRASLKAKLALVLASTAVLPLVLVSAFAIRVALGRLERGLENRARQTASIATNLLLRHVQRISAEARILASAGELHELLSLQPLLVPKFLRAQRRDVQSVLVEVADAHGRIVGRRGPADPRFDRLRSSARTATLRRALAYEHRVTVDRIGGTLVIQAAAPAVDSQFVLRGAVVVTTPLDAAMADYIKGVVRAEIGFHNRMQPVASTLFDAGGRRLAGPALDRSRARNVMRGAAVHVVRTVGGGEHSLAFSRLQTVEGRPVGMMMVGLDRGALARARHSALRSLGLGGALALVFALALAVVFGRRITRPLSQLQRRTQAIAAGDLHHELTAETQDEIGQLARSFRTMTEALREKQQRLDARIRELSKLHEVSRAISSVLGLQAVLRLVVTEVAALVDAERAALLLARDDGDLVLAAHVGFDGETAVAAPVPPADPAQPQPAISLPAGWAALGQKVVCAHAPGVHDRSLAVPLETPERVVGALVVARGTAGPAYLEAEVRLVLTFAAQAAIAIDNARLYEEVRSFSEQLERQVRARTAELQATNEELERALVELREMQAQLIHSERMAGLGGLVAGVAHEINTPAGAIHGAAQVLSGTLDRAVRRMNQLMSCGGTAAEAARRLLEERERLRTERPLQALRPAAEVHREARALASTLEQHELPGARRMARRLVEADAVPLADQVVALVRQVDPELVVGLLEDLSYVERSAHSIQTAIAAVVRIVASLRSYAHSSQGAVAEVDISEGLETTLSILHSQLRYGITLVRNYGPVPRVAAYVDELNQVWTNLIHNAIQAMKGRGELTIETFRDGEEVGVRITDSGPGIPPEALPRIFEPFFSTKPRGEGTGLGLGIARKIVERHGGDIAVQSRPGRTTFTVLLPLRGPPLSGVTEHSD